MSTTTTTEEPRYESYYRENAFDNKREILTGAKAVNTFNEIPMVDISRISSEDSNERKAAAEEIAHVCKRVGFMYIKGHGIQQELVDRVFAMSAEFHHQPKEIKQECWTHNPQSKELRGWNEHFVDTPEGPVRELILAKY